MVRNLKIGHVNFTMHIRHALELAADPMNHMLLA